MKRSTRALLALVGLALVGAGWLAARSWGLDAGTDVAELRRENRELREIMQHFGKEPVEVYGSLTQAATRGEGLKSVTVLRPTTLFEERFYRFRAADGTVYLVRPASVAVLRVSAEAGETQ